MVYFLKQAKRQKSLKCTPLTQEAQNMQLNPETHAQYKVQVATWLAPSVASVVWDSWEPHRMQQVRRLARHYLPGATQVHIPEIVMLSSHHPTMFLAHCPRNLSQHQGFFNELAVCIRWLKYWASTSALTSSSSNYSVLISLSISTGLISYIQGTFRSLPSPQWPDIEKYM